MPSLTDLFNPSFLMFLGILVLVVALLVVYFESKMREQNHKIASMLSLVSTLAEDINGIKFGLNQLSIASVNNIPNLYTTEFSENVRPLEESFNIQEENKLIHVSDDDDDDESNDDDDDVSIKDDSDDDNESNVSDNVSDTDSDDNNEDIKVLKLTINKEFDENDKIDEIDELEDLEDNLSLSHSDSFELNNDIDTRITHYEIKEDEDEDEDTPFHQEEKQDLVEEKQDLNVLESEFKKININLEETNESQDYKKLSLNKLRSIVTEKGLSTDSSKLKKPELLKLLGFE